MENDSQVASPVVLGLTQIHFAGDFNDANMLIDSNFMTSGVIDFGDSVER